MVDPKNSQWREWGPGHKTLEKPDFRPERFGEHTSLFKIPENLGLVIYCLERTAGPYDAEFKALADEHALTGLEFEPIWTDRNRKIRKLSKPTASDIFTN